jgi:hypothetical protein
MCLSEFYTIYSGCFVIGQVLEKIYIYVRHLLLTTVNCNLTVKQQRICLKT